MYEAYGPEGTAYIIECLTDNTNRTLPNVKTILMKKGGKFAEKGSVSFMFEQKGVVVADITGKDGDEIELSMMDLGAEDIDRTETTIDVTTSRDGWHKVRGALTEAGCEIQTAGLKYVPSQSVSISDAEKAKKVFEFMSALEEDEDVSEVHTNADISEEVAKELS